MPHEEKNTTVSFRLSEAEHETLVREAQAAKATKHQHARSLLVRALNHGVSQRETDASVDLAAVEEAFQAVQTNLSDLRMALGRGVGAILQHVARDMDKEDIRRWVFERIVSASTQPGGKGTEG